MASSLSTSSLHTSFNFIPNFRPISGRSRATLPASIMIKNSLVVSAARGSSDHHADEHEHDHGGGRVVDENMIVLRRRIHETKVAERNYEPPSDWMQWEKEWFVGWDGLVYNLVGILQSQMMNTRPALTLGLMALVALSVPFSTAVVLFRLMDVAKVVSGQMLHMLD